MNIARYVHDMNTQDDNPNRRAVLLAYNGTNRPYSMVNFGDSALNKYFLFRHQNGVAETFGPIERVNMPFSTPSLTLGTFISAYKKMLSTDLNLIGEEMRVIIRDIAVTHLYCAKHGIELDVSPQPGNIIDGIFVEMDSGYPYVVILPIRKLVEPDKDKADDVNSWRPPLFHICNSIKTLLRVDDRHHKLRPDYAFGTLINKLENARLWQAEELFGPSASFFWSEPKKSYSIQKLKCYVEKYDRAIHTLNPAGPTVGWPHLKKCRQMLEKDTLIGAVVKEVYKKYKPEGAEFADQAKDSNALIKMIRDLIHHFEKFFQNLITQKKVHDDPGFVIQYLEYTYPEMMKDLFQAAYYASISKKYKYEFNMDGF